MPPVSALKASFVKTFVNTWWEYRARSHEGSPCREAVKSQRTASEMSPPSKSENWSLRIGTAPAMCAIHGNARGGGEEVPAPRAVPASPLDKRRVAPYPDSRRHNRKTRPWSRGSADDINDTAEPTASDPLRRPRGGDSVGRANTRRWARFAQEHDERFAAPCALWRFRNAGGGLVLLDVLRQRHHAG